MPKFRLPCPELRLFCSVALEDCTCNKGVQGVQNVAAVLLAVRVLLACQRQLPFAWVIPACMQLPVSTCSKPLRSATCSLHPLYDQYSLPHRIRAVRTWVRR